MVIGRRAGATVAAFGYGGIRGGKAGIADVFVQGVAREFGALFQFQTAHGQSTPVRKTVGVNQGRYPRGVLDSRFGWIVFVRTGGTAFARRCY